MDPLRAFGLFAVTAMLVCYALEHRNRMYVLGFAGACALGSIYRFLQRVAVRCGRSDLVGGRVETLATLTTAGVTSSIIGARLGTS